ncbi:tail fiber protein [Bifidobacterium tissieri]|uniref:Tail fiber protein n=1 Tax=Bifidobacterium tissieri TaxID=1630162 RepID=A0A261FCZ2_9BIFI|nr:collagen-like protein [Bifidobacterium tissieri]OZG57019.1 tail fiber protein [Bifidobacterium tissieri]
MAYEIEQYRTIETTLDLANDYTPPIRLNAGDRDGRILKFNITNGGDDVDDLNGLSARLTWNRDPTDPSSGGGYADMSKKNNTDNATGVHQVSFTTPVPTALLQQASDRMVVGIEIEDADWHVIASRNIPVIIEPSRINPKAPEIADPLKDLHETIGKAQELIDTASIDIGTVTTLTPTKKATGALTGTGLKRKLNLGIPRGSKISSVTATALDTATPTVTTGTDTNGDITIVLGLPRGKQGEKGDKGDPGEPGGAGNVPIATSTTAGIVKIPTSTTTQPLSVASDGTVTVRTASSTQAGIITAAQVTRLTALDKEQSIERTNGKTVQFAIMSAHLYADEETFFGVRDNLLQYPFNCVLYHKGLGGNFTEFSFYLRRAASTTGILPYKHLYVVDITDKTLHNLACTMEISTVNPKALFITLDTGIAVKDGNLYGLRFMK